MVDGLVDGLLVDGLADGRSEVLRRKIRELLGRTASKEGAEQRSRSGTLSKAEMWGCLGIEVDGCQASQANEKVITESKHRPRLTSKSQMKTCLYLGLYVTVTIPS